MSATPQSQYLDIPLDQLHDSPTQPRLAYNEAYLQELAADIKSHGRNLSPLLVRPIVPALFAAVGDEALSRDATAGYEIVFGHCRKRACEIAGLTHARCEVRPMTDIEVERAQISENLQRKDVHPFEEAQAYAALIEKHADTADAIAERTGKSRSYIYGRLKLLQACEEVRRACVAGEIGAEVALLVARLRTVKLQGKALARIRSNYLHLEDGGKKSYRQIRELLAEEFTLDLKGAIFSPTDEALVPSAGACTTCTKRSANAPEYRDLVEQRLSSYGNPIKADPNLCTDPECFAAKKVAHLRAEAGALRAKGKNVIDGNRARTLIGADGKVKGGYVPLAQVKDEIKRAAKRGNALGSWQIVTIQSPRDGKTVEAVKVEELVTAGVLQADSPAAAAPASRQAEANKRYAERVETAEQQTQRNHELLRLVRDAARGQDRSDFDLRTICYALFDASEEDYQDHSLRIVAQLRGVTEQELHAQIKLLPAGELALLMLDIAFARCVHVRPNEIEDATPWPLILAAKHYGVELPEGSLPLPPAARAGNGTAEANAHSGQDYDTATAHPAGSAVESSPSTPAHAGEGVEA